MNKPGYDTGGYPAPAIPAPDGRDAPAIRYQEDRYNDPYPSGGYQVVAENDPYGGHDGLGASRTGSYGSSTTGSHSTTTGSHSTTGSYSSTGSYRTVGQPAPGQARPGQPHAGDPYPPDDRSSIVDPLECIDEISALVEAARAVPMSANCMVNRNDLLAMLDELRASLPAEIRKAQAMLNERDSVIAVGQREAERIIAEGEHEHRRLVSTAEVTVSAEHEASRIIAEARTEAQNLRDEIEEYVDTTLANFEQMLQRTMATVERGRDKMRALSEIGSYDGQAEEKPLPF